VWKVKSLAARMVATFLEAKNNTIHQQSGDENGKDEKTLETTAYHPRPFLFGFVENLYAEEGDAKDEVQENEQVDDTGKQNDDDDSDEYFQHTVSTFGSLTTPT